MPLLDFKFRPSIDPKQIRELATGRSSTAATTCYCSVRPGAGKSHLAIALGIKACEQGVRILFVTEMANAVKRGRTAAAGKPAR